jgi:hypothetical protein
LRWGGTDVENLLFNNIDQTLSLFAAPANAGVRFHDLGIHAPADPTGHARSSHYAYDLIASGEPFTPIPGGKVICSIPATVIRAGEQRIATRIDSRSAPPGRPSPENSPRGPTPCESSPPV